MREKYKYEDVKNHILSLGCKLLSEEYNRKTEKLEIECSCGRKFFKTYQAIKVRNICRCDECFRRYLSSLYSFSYDYVKNYIEGFGCTLLSDTYENNQTKLRLKCSCGNKDWITTFADFSTGFKMCNDCNLKRLTKNQSFTTEEVRQIVSKYGYILEGEYINSHTRITLLDNIGYRYFIKYMGFYNGVIKLNGKMEFVSPSNSYSFENIKKYIAISNLNFDLIGGYYTGKENKTLICKCKSCNETWDNEWGIIRQNIGCPYCGNKKTHKDYNLGTEFPELQEEWDYEKNKKTIFEYRIRSNANIFWICSKCGEHYQKRINKRSIGQGCPKCYMSGGSKKIMYFLENNGFCFDYDQPKFLDLLGDFKNLRYDFIIYENITKEKILKIVEFDGEQHESYSPWFHKTEDDFLKSKRYDKIKDDYAKDHGYSMIRIKQKQFKNIFEILTKELNL